MLVRFITHSVINQVVYTPHIFTSDDRRALWVMPSVDSCNGRPGQQGLRKNPQSAMNVEHHQEIGSAKGAEFGKTGTFLPYRVLGCPTGRRVVDL